MFLKDAAVFFSKTQKYATVVDNNNNNIFPIIIKKISVIKN